MCVPVLLCVFISLACAPLLQDSGCPCTLLLLLSGRPNPLCMAASLHALAHKPVRCNTDHAVKQSMSMLFNVNSMLLLCNMFTLIISIHKIASVSACGAETS